MNIVIVGLGIIGGSFAMALKEAGYEDIYGIDTNEETLIKAKEMGLIKEGSVSGKELLKNADLTVTPGWIAESSSTPVVAAFNQTLAVQNFLPENIKKGIDILGVQGTLDYIKTVTSIPTTQDTSIIYNSTDRKYYLWRA